MKTWQFNEETNKWEYLQGDRVIATLTETSSGWLWRNKAYNTIENGKLAVEKYFGGK